MVNYPGDLPVGVKELVLIGAAFVLPVVGGLVACAIWG